MLDKNSLYAASLALNIAIINLCMSRTKCDETCSYFDDTDYSCLLELEPYAIDNINNWLVEPFADKTVFNIIGSECSKFFECTSKCKYYIDNNCTVLKLVGYYTIGRNI